MSNSIKRIASTIITMVFVITMLTPTTALAATPAKTFGGSNVVVQNDGTEVEYYQDYMKKVYYDLPLVTRTIIPGKDANTIRYDLNEISNMASATLEHKITRTGAYMTVDNIVRESQYEGSRLLYAKGPVKLTFSASSYTPIRKIGQFSKYDIQDGRVLYIMPYDYRTKIEYSTQIFYRQSYDTQTVVLDKPGLYSVRYEPVLSKGVFAFIYIADSNENVNYTAPKKETAKPSSVNISVDGKNYSVPAYNIKGENFVKVRDAAYILNGTAKQFAIAYVPGTGLVNIKTLWYDSKYTPVGGELSKISNETKTAVPSTQPFNLNSSEINPLAYNIDGSNYIRLRDIASIDDFGLSYDSSTGVISIDTSVGYTKPVVAVKVDAQLTVNEATRLAGDNRYQTSVAISKAGWTKSDSVVLASGDTYGDALVGSSFAYLKDDPILLTPSDKLDEDVLHEIQRLGAKKVYILGNYDTVKQEVESQLIQTGYSVTRICGKQPFDTAVAVANEVSKIKSYDTIFLVNQDSYADALAVAPFSAKNTTPIFFSYKESLREDTMSALFSGNIKNVIIAGGTGVVSQAVEDQIKMLGISVTRLQGDTRYDTALDVIKHFAPADGYKNISIATGESYPDALSGAVLAAKNNMPLVLVNKTGMTKDTADYLNKTAIDKVYIFGGTGVVADGIVTK